MKSNYLIIIILIFGSLYAKESLTISEAYQLGLSNAHKVKTSWYKYQAAKERIKQKEAALYPQLSLSARLSKKYNKIFQQSDDNTTKKIETEKSISLNFTQVIYDASLKIAKEIEEKRGQLSQLDHTILQQNFATEILKHYFDILQTKNRITVLKSYAKYYASLLKLAKGQMKFNLINEMELINIEVNYEKTKMQIEKEKELLRSYKKALAYLIDLPVAEVKLPQGRFRYLPNTLLKDLLATVKSIDPGVNSLEYQRAKKDSEIMAKRVKEAQSARLPKINFSANYTKYFSKSNESYYKSRKSVALQLNMPIYQGGRISAAVEEAKFNRLAALNSAMQVGKDVEIRYNQELANFKFLIKSVKIYKKAYKKAKLYHKLAKKGYKSGIKSIVDLYDSETKLNETKFKYMQNLYDLMTSYTKLLILSNNMDSLVLLDKIVQ